MNRTKIIFTLAGLLLATTVAITAYADQPGPDSIECSPNPGEGDASYELIEVNDADNKAQARAVDQAGNHDHHVCAKQSGNKETYIDNG